MQALSVSSPAVKAFNRTKCLAWSCIFLSYLAFLFSSFSAGALYWFGHGGFKSPGFTVLSSCCAVFFCGFGLFLWRRMIFLYEDWKADAADKGVDAVVTEDVGPVVGGIAALRRFSGDTSAGAGVSDEDDPRDRLVGVCTRRMEMQIEVWLPVFFLFVGSLIFFELPWRGLVGMLVSGGF